MEIHPWQVQIAGMLFIMGLMRFLESRAAMRGCHRQAMSPLVDRCLRLVFLVFMVGPFCFFVDSKLVGYPLATGLAVLYAFTYADLSEQHGGRPSSAVRKWSIWAFARRYFGIKLVKTVDLDPKKTYIFGVHPHGILPFGVAVALCSDFPGGWSDLFPGVEFRTLAATFCFYLPVYRDLLLAGGVVDAARYSANKILKMGLNLALVPGGATEALYSDPAKDVVYIKKRKGFVKLALEHGASLVPIFSFNENNTYSQMAITHKTVYYLKTKFQRIFGISLPLITNIIPKRTQVTAVVGRPIPCPKIENPSNEQVEAYLQKYIDGIVELYEANKDKYNIPKTKPPLVVM